MPFCIGTTTVSGPKSFGTSRATALHLMRFQGEDHEVLRPRGGVIRRGMDVRYGLLAAVAHHQTNAARLQRIEVRAARDEGDVLAGVREPRPDVAANRSDTDDRYLHSRLARGAHADAPHFYPMLRQAARDAISSPTAPWKVN